MIWRSWVRTLDGLNLGCVVLLSRLILNQKYAIKPMWVWDFQGWKGKVTAIESESHSVWLETDEIDMDAITDVIQDLELNNYLICQFTFHLSGATRNNQYSCNKYACGIKRMVECSASTLRKRATIHQVTTMLATFENVTYPSHNHLLTIGTDPTL